MREGSWSTGLLPAGKEVTELCNKAETWPKLRSGVMQDVRSMARAGCWERGQGGAAGTRLGWAGPAVAVLS